MTIAEIIQQLSDRGAKLYSEPGTVTAVNKDKRTCTVQPLNGDAELLNVRCQAVAGLSEGVLIWPKKHSQVLVSYLTKDVAYISNTTEVEEVEIISTGKIIIKNDAESLYNLLKELVEAIQALTVTTGTGPSGVPINIATFADIKTRLNDLFTE